MATKRQRGNRWEFIVRRKRLLERPYYLTFDTEKEGDRNGPHTLDSRLSDFHPHYLRRFLPRDFTKIRLIWRLAKPLMSSLSIVEFQIFTNA